MNNNNDSTASTCRIDTSWSPRLVIHHFDAHQPVQSTQDEARRLLQAQKPSISGPYLATIADRQTNGRGTQGRAWEGGVGNLYLTICVPYDKLPVTPTLLPLQIAVLVAERTTEALKTCRSNGDSDEPKVTVKWPNDVLINDQKLAGTLIESEMVDGTVWLLIGIGTNLVFAPSLDQSPGKNPRGATSIQAHCSHPSHPKEQADSESSSSLSAYPFGADLAVRLVDWLVDDNDKGRQTAAKGQQETQVLERWRSFAEFGRTYELRGNVVDEDAGGFQGEQVVSIDIQHDGQLRVRGENGRERLLIADYMF